MSENQVSEEEADQNEPAPPKSDSGRDVPLGLLMGGSILAVILVAALVVSAVIWFRGGDEPLVPAGEQETSEPAAESDKFEPEPFFDEQGRVVYIPKSDNGVILPQSTPAAGRSDTSAPSGIMLQRIHDTMYLPFSTSDGPTGFSDSGVATGFARTPQGAGLAGVHYFAYLVTGNTRIRMLQDAGLVSDPHNTLPKQIEFNNSGKPGAVPDTFPARVFDMIKVNYNDDIARVHVGASVKLEDGRIENRDMWLDLVWREGTGWVAVIPPEGRDDTNILPDFSNGWSSWW